jgi:hypothetical protein
MGETEKEEDIQLNSVMEFISGSYPKIYFIRCNEFIKIGKCRSDLSLRLSDLQIGNPYKLEMEMLPIPGDHELEQKIHKSLDEYWVRGEWFKITKDELKKRIKDICLRK